VKRCSGCNIEKPWSEFPRNRNTRDGLAFYCKACHNAKSRESKLRNNAGYSAYHRRHRYGVTKEDIEALLTAQGDKCPICQTRPLDHDHMTGEVRGILCSGCNGGLGQFKDNTVWLARAVLYLKDRDSLLKDAS
jgi:hypothetical protein